jgi:hypothetical protein
MPSRRRPEERAIDLENVMTWARNKDDDSKVPTGVFKKLDSRLPTKPMQPSEERVHDIENALNWCRNNKIDVGVDKSPEAFKKIANSPMPDGRLPEQKTKHIEDPIDQLLPNNRIQTPANRARDIEGVLDWTSNNDVPPEEVQSIPAFKKLPQEPDRTRPVEDRMKDLDRTLTRSREIEGALDWMRSNGVSPHDEDAVDKFNKLPSAPVSRRNPEQRAKDLEHTLDWVRNKGNADACKDPTSEFRKLDSMLPKKNGQTPADGARDVEGALDWMRYSGVSPHGDDALE